MFSSPFHAAVGCRSLCSQSGSRGTLHRLVNHRRETELVYRARLIRAHGYWVSALYCFIPWINTSVTFCCRTFPRWWATLALQGGSVFRRLRRHRCHFHQLFAVDPPLAAAAAFPHSAPTGIRKNDTQVLEYLLTNFLYLPEWYILGVNATFPSFVLILEVPGCMHFLVEGLSYLVK